MGAEVEYFVGNKLGDIIGGSNYGIVLWLRLEDWVRKLLALSEGNNEDKPDGEVDRI